MHQRRQRFAILFGCALWWLPFHTDVEAQQETLATKLPKANSSPVDFVRDVQPIFQRTCYSCHGAEKQEGGLRLDVRQRAVDGGDGGRVFIPGKSLDSRLIQLVSGLDKDAGMMPPEGEGTPLTADQIGILRAWIDHGAHWPDAAQGGVSPAELWALKPIQALPILAVRDTRWLQNPVDAFILNRLEHEKIAPSAPADRVTLLRRLHFDLLGLPPTPEEVSDYMADDRSDAYERCVDRLLASPHFGERWGRHWLDLARYADSDGYEKDRARPFAWRYREWVLEALNADVPFDRFTVEQIAGDLLPGATLEQRVATGFHRNTLHNTEGGADQEEDRVKKTVDRTNTLGSVWLGLTVGCAQCHSHKYDPLTQREYYQLFAFFNNLNESDTDAPLAVEQTRYATLKADFDLRHAPFVEARRKYEQGPQVEAQVAWERTATADGVLWTNLVLTSATSKHGATLQKQSDQSWLTSGTNKVSDVYTLEAAIPFKVVRAIRLEVLPDDSLPGKGPGRSNNGNFVLTTFTVETLPAQGGSPAKQKLCKAQASFSQKECDVSLSINDKDSDYWAVAPQFGQRHLAVFEFEQPIVVSDGMKLRVTLDQKYGRQKEVHNLGRFRLSVTDSEAPITLEGLPVEVAAAIAIPVHQRSPEQAKLVTAHFRTIDPEWIKLNQAVEQHAKGAPKPPATKAQLIAESTQPRGTTIHIRGDFLNPGDPVQPRTPALLPPLQPRATTPDRLDLAQWLISSENPLPPRVTVNRIWARIFGNGIVRTMDDFGKQGELPSHPELLDWLANDFRSHWSLKRIVRVIVTSAVYRQSSTVRTELQAIDPDNTFLARQMRRRAEAEVIRDAALAASGLLDPRVGGPSVRPPQPAEYANLTYANSAKWAESQGGDRYRRGIYTFFQRTSPYPMLMTFDSPDSNECCVRRETSNTPLQALTLWNDPAFVECAQAFGRRIMREIPDSQNPSDTIRQRALRAFTICLARPPSESEMQELVALYSAQRSLQQAQPELAVKLCGPGGVPEHIQAVELAAWIVVGRTLLNLDEFIMRE